jgi:hypothetical protein
LLNRLAIKSRFAAMAENHSDLILGIDPIADFRHQVLNFARMLLGYVPPFRAIGNPVV